MFQIEYKSISIPDYIHEKGFEVIFNYTLSELDKHFKNNNIPYKKRYKNRRLYRRLELQKLDKIKNEIIYRISYVPFGYSSPKILRIEVSEELAKERMNREKSIEEFKKRNNIQ